MTAPVELRNRAARYRRMEQRMLDRGVLSVLKALIDECDAAKLDVPQKDDAVEGRRQYKGLPLKLER